MSDFYFYTEPELLSSQNSVFGSDSLSPNDIYSLNNLFSASSNPKAFAITSGTILLQEVAGNSNLVNIILKPSVQPDLDLPKIAFIIYKGILKSELISGNDVAVATKNDLTASIWASQTLINTAAATPNLIPSSNCFGIGFTASASSPFTTANTDNLDKAFFTDDTSYQLPKVNAGWTIGKFDSTKFGILIAFEQYHNTHTFALARELDSKISISPLSSPTQAEKFEYYHKKETVLSYMDDAAFFGSFYTSQLQVFIDDEFSPLEGNDIYDDVLDKYTNKNKVYLDIRNEHGYSIDYYENYRTGSAREIKALFAETGSLTTLNYYTNDWPILTISAFASGNTTTKNYIRFQIPEKDNPKPLVFYSRAFKKGSKFQRLKNAKKFFEPAISGGYCEEISLITPNNNGGSGTTPIASYYQIKYLRQLPTPTSNLGQLTIPMEHYLDQLFAPFDMVIPFSISSQVRTKIYYEDKYIDRQEDYDTDYTANVGIAEDANNITLFAYPSFYRNKTRETEYDKLSLSSLEDSTETEFLKILASQYKNINVSIGNTTIGAANYPYYKFESNEINEESEDESTDVFNQVYFENVALISLSKTEWASIQTLKSTNFTLNYRVYLGVSIVAQGFDDFNNPYTQFELVLRGLEEVSGNLQKKETATGININTYGIY